jgi:uncharacterized small protein (DUF1192 family)
MFDEEGRKIDLDTPRERKLEGLSAEAMQEYIGWLKGEIVRVESEITRRGAHKNAADAFFK